MSNPVKNGPKVWPIGSRADLGAALTYRRAVQDMTQTDIAKAMFVPQQYVSRWETGETIPRLETLLELLELLGCELVVRETQ